MATDDAKVAEQAWHDRWYREHSRKEFPDDVEDFREMFWRIQLAPFFEGGWGCWGDVRTEMMLSVGDVVGRRVLDYGCGHGGLGIYLALKGAIVSGFDISTEGVNVANWAAEKYHLQCDFRAMDAESLAYEDQSFDLVMGFGVIHHVVKYPRASSELFRVMKPGAKAMFHETIWENPLINYARRFTMADADAGDEKLTGKSILSFGAQFSSVEINRRHIFYMLKRLARQRSRNLADPMVRRPIWKLVHGIDSACCGLGLSKFCGEASIVLTR